MISDGSSSPKQLTFGGDDVEHALFSPDGQKIYYSKDNDDIYQTSTLYSINNDGTDQIEVFTSYDIKDPCISAGGSKIAYVQNGKIHLFDLTTKATTILSEPLYVYGLQFSPVEAKIYYLEYPYGSQIFSRVNLDGSNPENILGEDRKDILYPVLSSDGSNVVYILKDYAPFVIYKLMIYHFGSGEIEELADSVSVSPPAISPDGTEIAFVSFRDGEDEIYKIKTDGSVLMQLTDNLISDDSPQFSPDGQKIVFRSKRENLSYDIFIMNADGTEQANLSNNEYHDRNPVFQPGL